MLSLFADQEREAQLDSLGHPRGSQAQPGQGRSASLPNGAMTRLLVLQQLFNLSDEQMEFQLLDRMSFQRFAGLKHSGRAPDRNTIWLFRERLVKTNVEHQIFAEVQRQLQAHGFRAREGQIIDASIVRALIQHNTTDERAVPVEWSPAQRRQKDVEARWTKKHGKSYLATSCRSAWIVGTS